MFADFTRPGIEPALVLQTLRKPVQRFNRLRHSVPTDNASVRHPDPLSNDMTLREGPADLGMNDIQNNHTVMDGAPGVAATILFGHKIHDRDSS